MKEEASKEPVALWTPWGTVRTRRPGERFAALRRLALRLRSVRAPAKSKDRPPN
jgi:hypothetical protein